MIKHLKGRKMDKCNRPIGIFDSGAGGISFLRAAREALTYEDFIYFGDSGNAPYGIRPLEEIRALTVAGTTRLYDMGVKALVVACNTASSAAVADVRAALPIPILAMEPALKPALHILGSGNVIVMATPATLKQEMFRKMMTEAGNGDRIIQAPCPALVELVEAGEANTGKTREAIDAIFLPYKGRDIDAIVLGCTHFILAATAISECACGMFSGKHTLLDGNAGTVAQLKKVLEREELFTKRQSRCGVRFLTSSPKEGMLALYNRYLEKGE